VGRIGRTGEASRIAVAWAEQKVAGRKTCLMHNTGAAQDPSGAYLKEHRLPTPSRSCQENPYRMARDIRGIGFKDGRRPRHEAWLDKNGHDRVSGRDLLCS